MGGRKGNYHTNRDISLQYVIMDALDPDFIWLKDLWEQEWGGLTMVSGDTTYHLTQVKALLAKRQGTPIGAITWAFPTSGEAEIVSLNALFEGQGVGSLLLQSAEQHIRHQGAFRIQIVTSNDNLRALAFYQKRGYRLKSLHPGAIDRARLDKPSIPGIADNGIPIHDELVLEKLLI